jgi:hypothetical protein
MKSEEMWKQQRIERDWKMWEMKREGKSLMQIGRALCMSTTNVVVALRREEKRRGEAIPHRRA